MTEVQRLVATARDEARLVAETPRGQDSGLGSPPDIPGYRVGEELCRGAQRIVYRAISETTNAPVALKVLGSGRPLSPDERLRFDREVALLRRLVHPGIVQILDHGCIGDRVYFTMPL